MGLLFQSNKRVAEAKGITDPQLRNQELQAIARQYSINPPATTNLKPQSKPLPS